jgi:hypothetical protein
MEHVVAGHVRYVGSIAENELPALVARETLADPAVVTHDGRALAITDTGKELNSVQDFGVAGAATKMDVDRFRDLSPRGVWVLLEEVFRAQGNARDAKPTLEASGSDKRVGQPSALLLRDSFEGEYLLVGRFLDWHRAGDERAPTHNG